MSLLFHYHRTEKSWISNPFAKKQWPHSFWADSQDSRLFDETGLVFRAWSIEQYGEPVHSFDPIGRWGFISGGSNTWVYFLDSKDAMMFKLRFGGEV